MPLDPENKPREFLVIVLAVGLKIWGNKPWSADEHLREAESFVTAIEQRYGKLNP